MIGSEHAGGNPEDQIERAVSALNPDQAQALLREFFANSPTEDRLRLMGRLAGSTTHVDFLDDLASNAVHFDAYMDEAQAIAAHNEYFEPSLVPVSSRLSLHFAKIYDIRNAYTSEALVDLQSGLDLELRALGNGLFKVLDCVLPKHTLPYALSNLLEINRVVSIGTAVKPRSRLKQEPVCRLRESACVKGPNYFNYPVALEVNTSQSTVPLALSYAAINSQEILPG